MKKQEIQVVARAVIRAGNYVLVARCKGASNTFLPGGHVRPGEAMQDAIARELREEFGELSSVGDYIGAVEHSFSENGLNQHEINHLFDVELPDVQGLKPITSLESHLEFFWHPIGSLGSINLAPAPVVAWIEMPNSGIRWASTLRRNAGEPNKPLQRTRSKRRASER